jgi:PAS domain S-box-containing protein
MRLRDSLSRKLTLMNMIVSAGALVLAALAFFAYDVYTFRANLRNGTSIQAQIIGSNAVSPLIFDDAKSAEATMAGLRSRSHTTYAGIYRPDGEFFAGYWPGAEHPQIALPNYSTGEGERAWFEPGKFSLIQTIKFEDKPVGIVFIQKDLLAINGRLKDYATILLLIVAASLIAALALSRFLQGVVARPILSLAGTAKTVSQTRNYAVRADTSTDGDEVALLVRAFNEMLSAIQQRDSALRESEQQFRTLADSIPQLAWMATPDGERSWFNQRWSEYTGIPLNKSQKFGWQAAHDPAVLPEVLKKWEASRQSGETFEMIYPLRGADGVYRPFLTRAMPVRDSSGNIARWFGTNTDITEQRRSEEALRQTEKLAATGRLAASIAHEINNPLEAVTNLVYLAQKQPANLHKYLKLADSELDRIAQITKNTLGFYRDSAAPSEMDISAVLNEVVALYRRKLEFKRIVFQPEFADGTMIIAYPGEVRQIFANLVANAIEAVSDAGCLSVRVSRCHFGEDRGKSAVRVTFKDNGTGIPEEQRKRIFEPFYTTKKDIGTGLGLWLTRGLVQKHGGVLQLRSSTKAGESWTAFSVILPETPLTP